MKRKNLNSKASKEFIRKRRVSQKENLVKQLKELIKEDAIEPWFNRPNKMFDGWTPNQLIEIGESNLIQDMIFDMASGAPS
jgi:hypothetical protein